MTDIENIVINTVANNVWSEYPDIDVTSDYSPTPSSFPCVFIYEMANTAYRESFDDSLQEHQTNVMYQIDVFALTKSDAKKLRALADSAMSSMKFTRTYSAPTLNIDRTIKRYTSRYTAVVGELTDNKYQMYRS